MITQLVKFDFCEATQLRPNEMRSCGEGAGLQELGAAIEVKGLREWGKVSSRRACARVRDRREVTQ